MPDYAIIIPAYNEEALLPDTLVSVRDAMAGVPERQGEVIVSDNASTDGTAEVAAGHGARVVQEPHRQIARARNTGARHTDADYLIFLDADTLMSSVLLRQTLAALDSGRICAGGTCLSTADGSGFKVRLALATWHFLQRTMTWAAGSYVFCLREAFEAVGGFNEAFYASEEIILSNDLKRWGRGHQMSMKILREPALTSMRKFEWYSTLDLVKLGLRLVIHPSDVKKRDACPMWYQRPGSSGNSESTDS